MTMFLIQMYDDVSDSDEETTPRSGENFYEMSRHLQFEAEQLVFLHYNEESLYLFGCVLAC